MPELSGVQFFDPKPYFTKGGQGKFFADPKPTDEHRYQRGYTPDRMAAVRQMPIDVVEAEGRRGLSFSGPTGPRQIHETIARSTTPTDEVPDTQRHLKIHPAVGYSGTNNRAGVYRNIKGAVALKTSPGSIHLAGGDTKEGEGQTLLHELGHWASNRQGRESAWYDTPTQRGKEEAFADDNMAERWRPDPRDVRKGVSKPPGFGYEMDTNFQGLGGAVAHKAYIKARRTLKPEVKDDILKYGFNPHGKIIGSHGHNPTPRTWQPGLSAQLSAYRETGKMPGSPEED